MQVAAANGEIQIQPSPAHPQQKEQVAQQDVPGAKGPQEAIEYSQSHPQQASGSEALKGKCRWSHRSSRLNQPPCLGSS